MIACAPTSTPRVGCDGDRAPSGRRHLAPDDQLLLVAARQRERRHLDARRAHVELLDDPARSRSRIALRSTNPPFDERRPALVAEQHVLPQREREHQAVALAVLRDVADAALAALERAQLGEVLAADEHDAPLAGRRPMIASMSSVWPLPSTPAMPTISPAWTSNDTRSRGRWTAGTDVSAVSGACVASTCSSIPARRSAPPRHAGAGLDRELAHLEEDLGPDGALARLGRRQLAADHHLGELPAP